MDASASRLREATRRRFADGPPHHKLEGVAEAIAVTRAWLEAFSKGRMVEPGVNKIVALYDYLGERLDLRK